MLTINGNNYKLCLFDTNALSNFIQYPDKWITYLDNCFSISKTIISYSVFTLSELWHNPNLFNKYIDIFSVFPSAILDGYDSIFIKEINNYLLQEIINPIIVLPFSINDDTRNPKEKLEYIINESGFIEKSINWRSSRKEVLDGMIELVNNYPPKSVKYTKKEIEDFIFIASTQQLILRNKSFCSDLLSSNNIIDIERFPSVKTQSYFVFYKFYPDNRKPILSDVFDILISSMFPYVDIVLTEGNMCKIIDIMKTKHNYLNHLLPVSIREINCTIADYA